LGVDLEKLKEDFGYVWQNHVITGFEVDKEILKLQLAQMISLCSSKEK
jgi:hypothetical protein